MKKTSLTFKKVPYDCWTEIISYFDSTKDWFSLILVVKGLYDYVNRVNPTCMENIVFSGNHFSGGFPERPQPVVLKFSVGSERAEVDLFHLFKDTYECSSFVEFFEQLPSKFPNLERLFIHLSFTSEMGGEKRPSFNPRDNPVHPSQYVKLTKYFGLSFKLFEHTFQRKFEHLVRLDLVLTRMDVELKSVLFPNLQSLRVMNMGGYYDVDLAEGYHDNEGLLCDQRKFFLQNDCFPRLQSIELHGYYVSSKLVDFRHQLTELYLGHCEILEKSVTGFRNLETLGIGCGGNVELIEDLPKLTKFNFYDNGFFMREELGRVNEAECGGFPTSIKLMKNLPCLTSVHINNNDSLFGNEWSLIELRDLMQVEDIVGQSCGMKILNLPNLRKVKFVYCESLEISSDSLMNLEEFDFSNASARTKVDVNLSFCSQSLKAFRFPEIIKREANVHESLLKIGILTFLDNFLSTCGRPGQLWDRPGQLWDRPGQLCGRPGQLCGRPGLLYGMITC